MLVINTDPPAYTLSDNRRIGLGMGWKAKQSAFFGSVDYPREGTSLQQKGNDGHNQNVTAGVQAGTIQSLITCSERQPNGRSVLKKRRRHSIGHINGINLPSFPAFGYVSDSAKSLPPPRNIQCRGRSSLEAPGTSRVALAAASNGDHIPQVGNAGDRPVCIQNRTGDTSLLHARPKRRSSSVLRRLKPNLELQASLGFPATVPNSQSPSPYESGHGDIFNRSPEVGQSILAGGSEEPSSVTPTHDMEPREGSDRRCNRISPDEGGGHDTGSLEMWGWSRDIETWSTQQKSLLLSSWRPSTLKTYEAAWKRWFLWAQNNNVNHTAPTGSILARYLSDLHQKDGLAYSTILVHKSVVSSLCNADDSGTLSSHKLVKQVLKAIALQKPKIAKPPVWDTSVLVSYMSSRQIRSENLYDVSRHTATILLLCSGRRVHDLTLLCIDPDHMTESDDHTILWPRFGSKTDSADYRQSGWKLFSNNLCQAADPVYWIKRLIELSKPRREVCKNSNLFLTITGIPRPASRTIIAGWVKTMLRDAGIKATPGSVRAAVASKNWVDNFPLDSILEQGNWRSGDTFRLFYRREVIQSNPRVESNNLSNLFQCT
ncbi:uncharacterized protein [Choristoneura fumiferana]|uniref:uncharacterized protein n=1 Tax=Choristoneura fumiferana TaxID=7141 RepID=UPI003D15D901